MPVVHIPAPLRHLTGGEGVVEAAGATLGDVIDSLEARYPGLRNRLAEGERIRPGMAVFVDGVQVPVRLSTRIADSSEIYFTPALSGG
jgi:molybdopterin synthase sulfur carrier subunit